LIAFLSQLRPRQVILNHVQIRQATKSLEDCKDVADLCRVLAATMSPLGFEGFRIRLLTDLTQLKPLVSPLRIGPDGELACDWTRKQSTKVAWELKLDLVSSSGDRYGSLSLQRPSQHGPLLIDVNLLTDGFQTSLSAAVKRTLVEGNISANQKSKSASAASSPGK
jgi:hypothetical protein